MHLRFNLSLPAPAGKPLLDAGAGVSGAAFIPAVLPEKSDADWAGAGLVSCSAPLSSPQQSCLPS